MPRSSPWAVIVAALAAFLASSVWYIVFGTRMAQLSSAFAGHLKEGMTWRQPAVLVQGLVIAVVLARLFRATTGVDWKGALALALWLWVGLVAVQWTSAMMWEDTPWELAAIHAGDWLLKLLLVAGILSAWRVPRSVPPSPPSGSSP